MNNKSFLVSIAMIIMAGCVSEDDALLKTRVPISLTTSIAPTRATQDVQIGDGQEVYIWANEEEVSGTTNWDANNYIEAWHLTANATGGLTSANTYYYPTRPLSMVAIHGNFEFDEGKTQFPGVVSHTILADQSTAANLMKSDLLWWKGSGITSAGNPGGIPVTFAHNLSKIEITLSSDFYTTDQLNAMEVSLCNVLPTVDLSLADGTTNAAHGTRITVTPLKPSASSPTFEAVIPAQARPDNFIVVRLDGGVVNVDAQVSEFDTNTRYPYNLDITYRDVRKNPLWYVAEYNVNYDGSSTYSWATTPDEGYYFRWWDAKTAARKFEGWHLPTQAEWQSIIPSNNEYINSFDTSGNGTFKPSNVTVQFNCNYSSKEGIADVSYWKNISETEIHAIRFLGTDYCSAWKYVTADKMFVVSATLIGNIPATEEAASLWYTANWNNVFFGNNEALGAVQRTFYESGYRGGSGDTPSTNYNRAGHYWSMTGNENSDTGVAVCHYINYMAMVRPDDELTNGFIVRLFRNSRPKLPIEYILPFNMRSATGIAGTNNPNDSGYFYWGSNSSTPTANMTNFINGLAYDASNFHLPTVQEWMSIIPPYYATATAANSAVDVDGVDNGRIDFSRTLFQQTGLGEKLQWGRKSDGSYVVPSTKFYNEYATNSSYNSIVDGITYKRAYAIRLKATDVAGPAGYGEYTCAYRYTYIDKDPMCADGGSLHVKVRYLGASSTTTLSDIVTDDYWNEPGAEYYDVTLPACGNKNTSSTDYPASGSPGPYSTSLNPEVGYYWSSSPQSSSKGFCCSFKYNIAGDNFHPLSYSFSVRLFADD